MRCYWLLPDTAGNSADAPPEVQCRALGKWLRDRLATACDGRREIRPVSEHGASGRAYSVFRETLIANSDAEWRIVTLSADARRRE